MNINFRPNPILQDTSLFSSANLRRAADIALPFLSMHTEAAAYLSVGMGSARTWTLLEQTKKHLIEGSWGASAKNTVQCAGVVLYTGMAFVNPVGGALISLAIRIGEHTYYLASHLSKKEFKEFGRELLRAASTAVHLGSILTANPTFIFLSLSSQALFELGTSYGSYKEGKWPETISNLLLATIRLHGARPHFSRARRHYFGKELTQEDAIRLLEKAEELSKKNPSKLIDFEKLLESENYSNSIKGINYELEKRLSSLRFAHIQFRDCIFAKAEIERSSFDSCRFFEGDFTAARIQNTKFDHCLFREAQWVGALARDILFSHCSMNGSVFYRSTLDNVCFSHTSLNRACFNDSIQNLVQWDSSSLKESIFLGAQIQNCSLKNCDLTDAALCETETTLCFDGNNLLKKSKPVVSITWEFGHEKHFARIICDKLRKHGAMVLKYQGTCCEIDAEKLSQEVTEGLSHLYAEGIGKARSLGDALLLQAAPGSQIHFLYKQAEKINRYTGAILLPGGCDIEPELYGATRKEETRTEKSFCKSLLEMGLLRHAEQSGKRVLGICRGAQIINIFYEGTLHQHVEKQMRVAQPLFPVPLANTSVQKAREALFGKDTLYAISKHHQCIDRLGKELHILYQSDAGVLKAWMTENERILGVQFHPEIYDSMMQYSKCTDLMPDIKQGVVPWLEKKTSTVREISAELRRSSKYLQRLFSKFLLLKPT